VKKHVIGNANAALAAEGKIERFPYIRPGTGKRGRPGKLRLNELAKGDGLVFDEITGIAYQGVNLGLHEVGELIEIPSRSSVDALPVIRVVEVNGSFVVA